MPPAALRLAAPLAIVLANLLPAFAVPVAVPDTYNTAEDTPVSGGQSTTDLTNTGFEPASGVTNLAAGNWSYIALKNDQAGQTPDAYPVDDETVDWKSAVFNQSASSVSPWQSAPMPIQGGGIDAIAGAPNLLTGYATTPYTNTTYLFRKVLTVSAADAAIAQWALHYVVDDGAVFYLNGQVIATPNMAAGEYSPTGAITPLTTTNASPSEAAYSDLAVNLAGKLVAGTNVLAVEVHQTIGQNNSYSSSDAGIDFTLTPAGFDQLAGFAYADNVYNSTNRASSADGSLDGAVGNPGSSVNVTLSRGFGGGGSGNNASGGWRKTINVPTAGTVRVKVDARARTTGYETAEYIEAFCLVDTTRYSPGAGGALANSYLVRSAGTNASNSTGGSTDSGWATYTMDIPLTAGNHVFTFGAYGLRPDADGFNDFNENGRVNFDNLVISTLGNTGTLLANDTGSPTSAILATGPSHGDLTLNADGTFVYTPATNYNGVDTFTYRASDGVTQSDPATVTINISPVNDAPTGVADAYNATEDTPLTVAAPGVIGNDTDPEDDALTATSVVQPSNGTVTVNADGSFTYTPKANFFGTDTFTYRASDGSASSAATVVTITVAGTPDAPKVTNDSYQARLNVPLVVSSATTPTPVRETLIATGATGAIWRYLDDGSNQGTAWHDPAFDDIDWKQGQGEFGYGDGDENVVVNYGPDANNKYVTTYFRHHATINDISKLSGFTLRVKRDDGIYVYLNGSPLTGDLIGPDAGYNTLATNANDDAANFTTLTLPGVLPLVEGANVFAAEIHQSSLSSTDISFAFELTADRAGDAGVLANDTEPDGQAMTAQLVTGPAHGSLTLNPNGTFTYTPATGYVGPDSFTYKASDGALESAVATVNITVANGPNIAPIATADVLAATEDTVLQISAATLTANDIEPDNDPMTVLIVAGPSHGTLVDNGNQTFTYTPALNYNGADSFTYRLKDPGNHVSNTVTVTLNVAPVNDAPVAVADSYAGDPGVALVVSAANGVLKNDSDVDTGAVLTAALVSGPSGGTLTLNADGSFQFSAPTGGTFTFSYKANDGIADSNTVTVTVSLNAAPVAGADSYTTVEDTPLVVSAAANGVLKNDTDAEGQPLTAVLATSPAHGTLSLSANGTFTYTPASNYSGSDSFTYSASDGVRQSAPATVSLTITPVNDAPVVSNDAYSTPLNTALTVAAGSGVLANDSDPEGQAMAATLVTLPTNGQVTLGTDGAFTYIPNTDFAGNDTFTYSVSDGLLVSATATVTISVATDSSVVVINEIMFCPPGTASAEEEYLELYNTSTNPIDLTGWQFTSGVQFTFPAGTTIGAGAYLCIPANAATFHAKYPAAAYVNPGWGVASSLSNGGERIKLVDLQGKTADDVTYSDGGNWAVRMIRNVPDHSNTPGAAPAPVGSLTTRAGLEWVSNAKSDPWLRVDGGSSLQLRQPSLSHNNGQNWSASTPTPGAANTAVRLTNSAPLISKVKHDPAVPTSTQQVFVTATLKDESPLGVTASVFYRTWAASGTSPNSATFTEVPMADNGLRSDGKAADGEWGAVIPAQAATTVVEFYIRAVDPQGNARTFPAPTLDINGATPTQNANCLYQVDDTAWTDQRPLYRVVMTGADNAAFSNTGSWNSQSNVAPNATFIAQQGADFSVRYGAALRVRGNSSRSDIPRNWRLEVPSDDPWNGRTAFTLNEKYIYSQILGAKAMEAAGVPCEKGNIVGVRLNGVNHATDSGNTRRYGYYVDLIPMGGELIDDSFPLDDGGNGYTKIRGSNAWGTSSLPTLNSGIAQGGYVSQGYTKKGNSQENDWTDLHAYLTAINVTPQATFYDGVKDVVDIDEWARWWAVCTIINHAETNPANGDDDDYSLYFGKLDRRCRLIAHDFDTCFNLNAIGLGDEVAPPTTTIYQATDPGYVTSPTIALMDKFYQDNTFNRKFKAAMRRLLDTHFAKPRWDAHVDEVLPNSWVPTTSGIQAHLKSFMDTRRTTIETFLPTAFTATTTLTQQNGYYRTTSATALGALGGAIDPVKTAKVTVNGTTVTHSNYGNNWAAGTAISLLPGINPLLCQAWDENNNVVASQTVTIWYDDSTTTDRSGTLTTETWTAANGPYNVTASATVPSGVTLTIEPGTTVYLASGANLTVASGGRLIAAGTAARPIRFTRAPAATASWGQIVINGTSPAVNQISYATFEYNGSVAIHTQNAANVQLDHLTFLNTAVAYLSLDGSSFVVSDCAFPTPTAGFEQIHGTGGIAAGGQGIIRNCTFGKTQGYNDTIDFTGGNRPGPILHILNCSFNGSDDDILDLDSTDAYIEGNLFLHCHRNGSSPDSSSAVSGGADNADTSQITMVRNLVYDCDNAITMKQGNAAVLLNNTIVHTTKTGGIDGASGVVNFDDEGVAGEGKGFYLEGNIIWDYESLARNYNDASHDISLSRLVLVNNILNGAWTGEGSGNTNVDPQLNLAAIATPASATEAQVRAALLPRGCSPAIGTGPLGRDKGAYAAAGIAVATPPSAVWPATVALSVGPGGLFVPVSPSPTWNYGYTGYKFSIDGGVESAETPVATPLTLTNLANGDHTLTVVGKLDSGLWDTNVTTIAFKSLASQPSLVINEILAENVNAYAVGTARPDIVELYNYGTTALDASGYSLSDDADNPTKFVIPAGSTIPAGGYLVLQCDSLTANPGIHTGFGLDNSGETVGLYAPGAVLGAIPVSTVTFGPQLADLSVARIGSGSSWNLATPTIGAANTGFCDLGTGSSLKINEWLSSNDFVVAGDFVELFNADAKPVAIGDWLLTTDYTNWVGLLADGDGAVHRMPPLSFVAASGFLALEADGSSNGADHLSFKLSKLHESLALLDPTGALIDLVLLGPGTEDLSQGRTTDGAVTIAYLAAPTPGFSNATSLATETALRNGLRITEMMYNPAGSGKAEFIELKNIGATPLNLTGIRFTNGVDITFGSLTVPAGGYAVITDDSAKFSAEFPSVPVAGVYSGKLDNAGERVRFEVASYPIGVLDFTFSDGWYPLTDGGGSSLQIVSPTAAPGSWGQKASWQAGPPSPGADTAFGVEAGAAQTILLPNNATLQASVFYGAFSPAAVTVSWTKLSGPGAATFTAPANAATEVSFSQPGDYTLGVTITGPGAVTASDIVSVTANDSFFAWKARLLGSQSAANQDPTADPDGDGVPNLLEFVLGTSPTSPSTGVTVSVVGNRLSLTYTRPKLLDPTVQIVGQASTDCVTWNQGPAYTTQTTVSENGTTQTIRIEDAGVLGSTPRRFLRVKVTAPAGL